MLHTRTLAETTATVVVLFAMSALGRADEPSRSGRVESFDVRQVKLLDGPFHHAMQMDAKHLLSLDSDRLLSWYRKEANLEPRGKVYGGWESRGIAGHSLGHYLSACARMFHATGNQEFLRRVNYIVDELAKCQQAGGDGYVGAIPRGREVFVEVSRGDIRSAGFDLNGAWVPWYTLHKQFAGLIDAYQLCENEQALEVVTGLADWAVEITKNLTPAQWQQMLACEFGGMNESLAELYEITGNKAYWELAHKFYHEAILDPLADERDELQGKHSNTQIPKVIGAAKIASMGGDEKHAILANFFWQTMVENHSYVLGGNSLGEHLGPPGKLNDRLGRDTAETCNTYNMLKLTSALFAQAPQATYADYAERALLNHILASQNPETGMVCYFVPLQAGREKAFLGPEDFTCCSGTGMENHARYGEFIYARTAAALYVNQFIASELNWEEAGVRVTQTTELPEQGVVRLEIASEQPQEFALHVRHPHWAEQGMKIKVNGKKFDAASEPASFATIQRTWQDGDVVEIEMPLVLRLESMPDNRQRVAVFYGPILLAGLVDTSEQAMLPVLVTDGKPVEEWVEQNDREQLEFRTVGVGRPEDLTLAPFFAIHDRRYVVYWDLFTESAWQERQREYEEELRRQRELEARTVDWFAIGEMQPERDHNVQGEKTAAVEYDGRKLRHAWDGGWFSFDITLPEDAPADLVITYWGSEVGARTFDVLVDGHKLATQSLHQDAPGKYWDRVYPLPKSVTSGKQQATIKFQAHPGNYAGGVFGVRVVKREVSEESADP